MLKDFDIAGVYVTPFVADYLVAFCVFLVLRVIIARAGIERAFWRPELAETGVFLAILAVIAGSF
jgi:hypothetical protein